MGYNTTFKGELKFTTEPTAKQLAALNSMFGEDCREHPEWGCGKNQNLSYIDLVITEDFSGIRWDDGTEKTYSLHELVNVVLREMRKTWPDFGLTGQLLAQGEDVTDRWALVMEDDGLAHRREIAFTGQVMDCPHCGERIVIEGK